ncbi:DUF305 domain-containing protein [Cytophagaceae bacterium ABcell3]|nr:DUF305 domain-containing protein [Cytophagaceae bacterium ABcell3]
MNRTSFCMVIFLFSIILLSACRERHMPTDGGRLGDEVPGHVTASLSELMFQSLEQMRAMELTGDPDYDYASLMVIHHQVGIAMTDYQIRRAQDTIQVEVSRDIQAVQERELDYFSNYIHAVHPMPRNGAHLPELENFLQEFEEEKAAVDTKDDVEEDFPALMILHNEKGIQLANLQMEHGRVEEVAAVAEESANIKQSQIETLEALQAGE